MKLHIAIVWILMIQMLMPFQGVVTLNALIPRAMPRADSLKPLQGIKQHSLNSYAWGFLFEGFALIRNALGVHRHRRERPSQKIRIYRKKMGFGVVR